MVISLAVKQANIKIALPQEISNQLPSQCYDEPLPVNATDSVDREPFEMEPLRLVFKTTAFLKFKILPIFEKYLKFILFGFLYHCYVDSIFDNAVA